MLYMIIYGGLRSYEQVMDVWWRISEEPNEMEALERGQTLLKLATSNADWRLNFVKAYPFLMASIPQPDPTEGVEEAWERVIEDIEARVAMGEERYGKKLKTFNGRRALWDAYQEQIDLLLYLRQHMLELGY